MELRRRAAAPMSAILVSRAPERIRCTGLTSRCAHRPTTPSQLFWRGRGFGLSAC